jgi:SAM-dependent methyltransferase
MTADARTLAAYAANAAAYAARFDQDQPDAPLAAFIAALPPAAHVLDLGCGPASASAHMRAAGHHPDPTDASPEMVALANARHAINARVATFDDLTATAQYDAVWANFSLLHAPRAALPTYLSAIRTALKPNGIFHIAMKTGSGEQRDRLDRLYTYVTPDDLTAILHAAGFTILTTHTGVERGLAGNDDRFIAILSRAVQLETQ